MVEDVKYPLAKGDDVMYAPPAGCELWWMTPDEFLRQCPPLSIADAEEDGYIDGLVDRIKEGRPLDGLELHPVEVNGAGHDGRHRAWAAKIAGCKLVPVYVMQDMDKWRQSNG